MSHIISDKEMQNVLLLAAQDRAEHFVKRVADQEELWSLRASDGWVSGDFGGGEKPAFPVWPHAKYASLCASGAWKNATPEAICLEEFLAEWLPEMSEQNVPIAVFPKPQGVAVTMQATELSIALKKELENY